MTDVRERKGRDLQNKKNERSEKATKWKRPTKLPGNVCDNQSHL